MDNIDNLQAQIKKERELMDIRKSDFFPIVKNDNLYIYKISKTNELKVLINEFLSKYNSIYNQILEVNPNFFNDDTLREEYLSHYGKIVSYKKVVKDEFLSYFNIKNETDEARFIRANGEGVGKYIKKNDGYFLMCRMETLDEIIKRMDVYNVKFNMPSKLGSVLDYINNGFYDIELLISTIYEFLYSEKLNLTKRLSIMDSNRMRLLYSNFTNVEKNFSEKDKYNIVKRIVDAFNIELIYNKSLKNVDDYNIANFSIRNMIELGEYNYNMLYQSDFKEVFTNTFTKEKVKINKA